MLAGYNTSGGNISTVVQWYRVITVGDTSTPMLGLVGMDWDTTNFNPANSSKSNLITATVIAVDGVTGVYSATIPVEK
jgi:hypothetical protein